MKFEQHLSQHAVPEWRHKYIDYTVSRSRRITRKDK